MRFVRAAGLILGVWVCAIGLASAQTPQLVFTAALPEQTPTPTALHSSAVVEDRGLAMWGGGISDFGVGVAVSGSGWTVRSISSMTTLDIDGRRRPLFQQLEIVRPIFSHGAISVAGGGGIRQDWDGSQVLIGRVLAGSDVGRGRLQGSMVVERFASSPLKHDASDVVTSLGWSRRVGDRLSVGIEGIGQDLEGLWNPAELDGGATLLVGPSLHAQSKSGDWSASLTAGPVVHGSSVAPTRDATAVPSALAGRHFGVFASATWIPSLRR